MIVDQTNSLGVFETCGKRTSNRELADAGPSIQQNHNTSKWYIRVGFKAIIDQRAFFFGLRPLAFQICTRSLQGDSCSPGSYRSRPQLFPSRPFYEDTNMCSVWTFQIDVQYSLKTLLSRLLQTRVTALRRRRIVIKTSISFKIFLAGIK